MERHLDPIATAKLEEPTLDPQKDYIQVIVTHDTQQASRISGSSALIYPGDLIEYGVTDELIVRPRQRITEDYITGRFG